MGWDGHLRGLALLFGGVVFLTSDLKVCVCVCVCVFHQFNVFNREKYRKRARKWNEKTKKNAT